MRTFNVDYRINVAEAFDQLSEDYQDDFLLDNLYKLSEDKLLIYLSEVYPIDVLLSKYPKEVVDKFVQDYS